MKVEENTRNSDPWLFQVPAMKESIERVKETTESLTAKEEKLDDEINDTCDQLVIIITLILDFK